MKWIVIVMSFFFCLDASANTTICDTCSSDSQFRDAGNSMPMDSTNSTYVINSLSGVVKRLNRGRYPALVPAEQPVVNYVNFIRTYAQSQVQLDNQGDFPQNAYEMVEYPQLSTRVGAWIKQGGWGGLNDFLSFVSAVNPFTGFNPGAVSMTLRIFMADGSTSLFVYNHQNQTWERVKNQTRDSNNNIVPEVASDVGPAGTTIVYDFPDTPAGDQNFIMFMQRLVDLGIPVSGTVGGSGSVVVDCSEDACVVHPNH